MSKFTVIVDQKGELVAAQQGSSERKDGQEAGLIAGPGQTLKIIELPEHIAAIKDAAKFAKEIRPHIGR